MPSSLPIHPMACIMFLKEDGINFSINGVMKESTLHRSFEMLPKEVSVSQLPKIVRNIWHFKHIQSESEAVCVRKALHTDWSHLLHNCLHVYKITSEPSVTEQSNAGKRNLVLINLELISGESNTGFLFIMTICQNSTSCQLLLKFL